jgi:pimeloyl-ACP methyl ester carboxylesterase
MILVSQGRSGMPYAVRDDVRLYYEQAGSGGPDLLFVHGWCCDHTFFAPQFEHFAASHRVTAPDLRGCGLSDRPEGGYRMADLADDLAGFCCTAGLQRPVAIGHSLGGVIALELAARHPGLLRAVVVDDPAPIIPGPDVASAFRDYATGMAGPDGEATRRRLVESAASSTADPELRRRIVDDMCRVPLPIAAGMIDGLNAWDGAAALAACEPPLLVVLASPDPSVDPATMETIKPDVTFGITVGGGHFHQLEVPEQVNAMIGRFLEALRSD